MVGYFEGTENFQCFIAKIITPGKDLILDGELIEKSKAFQKNKS